MSNYKTDLLTFGKPLVEDFDRFTAFLKSQLPLTPGNRLKASLLSVLNAQMHFGERYTKPFHEQHHYPLLHLFYLLSQNAGLAKTEQGELVAIPQHIAFYESLNVVEKYFFLLETFWLRTQWDKLDKEMPFSMEQVLLFFFHLPRIPAGEWHGTGFQSRWPGDGMLQMVSKSMLYVGWFFGFYEIKPKEEKTDRFARPFHAIRVTPLAALIPGILVKNFPPQRDTPARNIGRETVEKLWYELYGELNPMDMNLPFIEPFQPHFPEGTLTKGLSPLNIPKENQQ